MKKVWGMLVLVMVLLAGTAMAADWQDTYPKADSNRLDVTVPEGLKYDFSSFGRLYQRTGSYG